MTIIPNPLGALVALGLAATGCTSSMAHDAASDSIIEKLRYETPQLRDGPHSEPEADVAMPLRIAASGDFNYDGIKLEPSSVGKVFKTLRAANFTKLAVVPDGDFAFGEAVKKLTSLAKFGKFELVELDLHAEFVAVNANVGRRLALPDFVGEFGDYELPLVVGLDEPTNQCVVSIAKWSIGSEELYDRSFDRLDAIVKRAGGVEALLKDEEALDQIVARLQSAPNTPWRCIAGAMHNLEKSGWPYISLEVIEQK